MIDRTERVATISLTIPQARLILDCLIMRRHGLFEDVDAPTDEAFERVLIQTGNEFSELLASAFEYEKDELADILDFLGEDDNGYKGKTH